MDLKDILKSRREILGLTLEEIGKAVGVSKTTVQRWESGEIFENYSFTYIIRNCQITVSFMCHVHF